MSDRPLTAEEGLRLLGRYLGPQPQAGITGVLVAVSGGPDSTALLGLAAALPRAVPLAAASVDHGLRPEAAGEVAAVARLAADLGVPHHALAWTGAKPPAGLPAAARAARYDLLLDLAHGLGASHLLTAHTRDDQAETVLMRLAAGSGVGGLAGMRAETRPATGRAGAAGGVVLARPLLGIARARLVATCRDRGWPFVEDPTNADPRFLRARLRRARTALAREGLTAARLARLATRAARAEDALEIVAADAFARLVRADGEGLVLDGPGLAALPDAVALRVVARALRVAAPASAGDGSGAAPRLERLEALVLGALLPALVARGRLARTLGGVLVALRTDGRLVLRPERSRRPGPPRDAPGTAPGTAPGVSPEAALRAGSGANPDAARGPPRLGKGVGGT